jgi:hypothetical protein
VHYPDEEGQNHLLIKESDVGSKDADGSAVWNTVRDLHMELIFMYHRICCKLSDIDAGIFRDQSLISLFYKHALLLGNKTKEKAASSKSLSVGVSQV